MSILYHRRIANIKYVVQNLNLKVTDETLLFRPFKARPGGLYNHATCSYICVSHRKEVGPDKSEASRGETRQGTSNHVSRCALRVHRGLVGAASLKNRQ